MKNRYHLPIRKESSGPPAKAMGWPVVVSLLLATSVMGQLTESASSSKPETAKSTTPANHAPEVLLDKVMTELPHFSAVPPGTVAVAPPLKSESPETVTLAPFVVRGPRLPPLNGPQLLTKKALGAEALRQYDYSAFSMYQHREAVRQEKISALNDYASGLMLIGDVYEGREIRKEASRMLMRQRDPETEYVDTLLNSRIQ